MVDTLHRLILASGSPRRLALLGQLGLTPGVYVPDVDEAPLPDEQPSALVERLARDKARAVPAQLDSDDPSGSPPAVVLAADTVIALDGTILGKPAGREPALAMLSALSGRTHDVISGVCVRRGKCEQVTTVVTRVRMTTIDRRQAARYWQSGEPVGKAGGYAIQGLGAAFVEHLDGSYSNVVGLPLFETVRLLGAAGLAVLDHDNEHTS